MRAALALLPAATLLLAAPAAEARYPRVPGAPSSAPAAAQRYVSIGADALETARAVVARHGERLSALQTAAVVLAAVGVAAGVVFAGGISWVTAAIALGYPLYFACRRRAALDTLPAFLGELVVLLPVAAVVLAQPHAGSALAGHPDRLGSVLLLAALGSVAFVLYLGASSRLPFGVFGLLTYLEPALLVVVSTTALGEPLQAGDALTFGPIAVALLLLAATRLVPPRRGRWAVRAG